MMQRLSPAPSLLKLQYLVMQDLFRKSAMTLVCSQQQRNFPADLFKVRMYALKPR